MDDERKTDLTRPGNEVPADAPTGRDLGVYGEMITTRVEMEAPPTDPAAPPVAVAPLHASYPPPSHETPPVHASGRFALPEMPAALIASRLPRWVLPYAIACLALALIGALVLWKQARVLGHF